MAAPLVRLLDPVAASSAAAGAGGLDEDVVGGAADGAAPFDVTADAFDAQAVLDAAPCIQWAPRRPPVPRYKPGTRYSAVARETVTSEGSWWTRPDADFAKEAQRMRDQPTKLTVPGELHILGMERPWCRSAR